MEIQPIAHIFNDFLEKFGIPRQSGLAEHVLSRIIFEPPYRSMDALRGIEGFSHLWLIWEFTEARRGTWSPTVRPPRLGGNQRMGVFATRSPFRPNGLGLSCVRLVSVSETREDGPVLTVAGADLMNGTPIYDIKPYLPYTDCQLAASGGFTDTAERRRVRVEAGDELLMRLPEDKRSALLEVLAQDPRPAYQDDPERVYGLLFGGWNVRFRVRDGALTVTDIAEEQADDPGGSCRKGLDVPAGV